MTKKIQNTIVLLIGLAGTGKKTFGKTIASIDASFRFVHHHAWIDPILNLFGDEASVMDDLPPEGWEAINRARTVIFDTITDVCPKESNFIISHDLTENNPWDIKIYEAIVAMASKRDATFIPIRLLCSPAILSERVIKEDRRNFFKTVDSQKIQERALKDEVLKPIHDNVLTLDTSPFSPSQTTEMILEHIRIAYGKE